MQFIAFLFLYPVFWLISLLPFRAMYFLSDVICFVIRDLIGYRKRVINTNLKLVFPEKSKAEIKAIRRQFYSHLCDLFLEMIKTLSISRNELSKRFIIKNPETLKQLEGFNNSSILLFGHYASYEWSTVIQSHISIKGLGIYKKLANTYFDRLVRKIRSKYNTELVNTKEAVKKITNLVDNKDYRMIAFLSDQSPKIKPSNVWLPFMGINIPCFVGAELTAKQYNFPVGFLKIDKVKRGFYTAEFIIITTEPCELENFEITKTFNRLIEQQIRSTPQYYLWTHKRWKHRGKEHLFKT